MTFSMDGPGGQDGLFWFLLSLSGVLGLCIGSFLNVVALRFLSEMPITHPASHCPHCQTPILPRDNIPVLGWLLLGGRCRACKARISVQYPLVELATGLLFAGAFLMFGLHWQLLLIFFLLANLVVIFITDLREKLIFEINSLSLIPVGLVYSAFLPSKPVWSVALGAFTLAIPETLTSALIAMAIVFIFFEGMILLSNMFFGTEGFGHGDTHLMMGAGAFLGWPLTILALLLGFVFQSIPAIPMLIIGWIRDKQYVSLISGAVSMILGGLPIALINIPMDPGLRSLLSLLFLVLSLVALIVFMRNIRQNASYTYLPLGPSLILGVLVALFAGQPILQAYWAFLQR